MSIRGQSRERVAHSQGDNYSTNRQSRLKNVSSLAIENSRLSRALLQIIYRNSVSISYNCRLNIYIPIFHPLTKGCINASLGVIRLLGSGTRHLSNRSTNDPINFASSSFTLTVDGINRDRRSLEALVMCTYELFPISGTG